MPLISSIGRKAPKTRLLIASLYAVLLLGGATMVYPFLLLIGGSTKSGVDIKDVSWLPAFLYDDLALYRKHIESLFNEQLDVMRAVYDSDDVSFERVTPPETLRPGLVAAWLDFMDEPQPSVAFTIGYMQAPVSRTVPLHLRSFKRLLQREAGPSIDEANRALETEYVGWNAFFLLPEDAYMRRSRPLDTPLGEAWRTYRSAQPPAYRYYFTLEGFYKAQFLKTQFTRQIDEFNRRHGTAYRSYDDIRLPHVLPDGTQQEQDNWESFVRHSVNLEWVRVKPSAAPAYRRYLQAKYETLEALNRNYHAAWSGWEEVPLVDVPPWSGLVRTDWEAFIAGWTDPDSGVLYKPAAEDLYLVSVDDSFRRYLEREFGSLDAVNTALETDFGRWADIAPPQKEAHYYGFLERRGEIRREFLVRNFAAALEHLAFHGRGIRNTIIYCGLAVLAALLVNPLAAYAMSRYKPPSAYKLLLFLLLTMAFPPMVTQIPVFLMMRDLNLLNTFAALLLPGLAHGYSIFLLKGFFDALPRDLYESAQIDGAGEWTMFWQITMSLSKPILAVVALQAFTTAYSNFMFALLICQDEAMWTMMVWLYQLQMRSGPGVVYASLLIAAIPTLLIFIFCQNIILRGIVVPVEK
ncbi:MAG TPA: carbohydrate ABC transporter permease [Kiritimatiellia bacterium]|nr:carbohydrate ABC transporter permease [Kiritimatiellia bacterium]HMO99516.1 carbohydrate ABC transporter permease [Kiritimatiellia bacterium]HMP97572.1 carbohydrate ABC transporter permease [Kiritimatiellia bacterium]